MRIGRSLSGMVALALVGAGGMILAPSAHAVSASPSAINVDCSISGSANISVTGAVGDTFSITNTAAFAAFNICDLATGSSYFSGMTAVPGGYTESYSIMAAGSFNVTSYYGTVATISISIRSGGNGDEHIPGTGVPRPQDVPNQSAGVTAVASLYGANVSWSAPTQAGEQPVGLYEVASSPGDKRCTASAPSTSCTVKGLDPRLSYTFTVKANSVIGWGPASAPSNAVTPVGASLKAPSFMSLYRIGTLGLEAEMRGQNPTGLPLDLEFEYAVCSAKCTSFDGLAWAPTYVMGKPDGWSRSLAIVKSTTAPLVVRGRLVTFDGQRSPWAYGVPDMVRDLKPVVIDQVRADATRALVSWADPMEPTWVDHYDVFVATKHSAKAASSEYRLVGSTSDQRFTVETQGAPGDLLRFRIISVPSFLLKLNYAGASEIDSAPSEWRAQANVPTPRISDASFGRLSTEVNVRWEPGTGPGVGNISGYRIQTRDRATGQWSSEAIYQVSGDSRFYAISPFDLSPATVSGIRIRATAGPGMQASSWAYALN